jgi:hypothetical protein
MTTAGAPTTSQPQNSRASTAVAFGLLSALVLWSCSLEHEIARVPVPDTNLMLVLTEDEKQMFRYQVLADGSSVLYGFLGPHDADAPHQPAVTREGNVVTYVWRGSLNRQFIQIDVATCQIVNDSHETKPMQIRGCASSLRSARP